MNRNESDLTSFERSERGKNGGTRSPGVFDYEKQLNIKIEERIKRLEKPDYLFAKRFGKKDYLITIAVVVFCLIVLIYGAYI